MNPATDLVAVYTDSSSAPEPRLARPLEVHVRAYGTLRGGLAEHVEEAIEAGLRAAGGGAPGTWSGARGADGTWSGARGAEGIPFDRDGDARLSDQLFRARRIGHDGIRVRLTALRALCAPVGGLDAADARAVAFYARAAEERPLELELDDGDEALPAFVVARTLGEVIDGDADEEEAETEAESAVEAPSVSLARLVADPPEAEAGAEEEALVAVAEAEAEAVAGIEAVAEAEAVAGVGVGAEVADEHEHEHEHVDPTNGRWPHYVAALEAARGPQTLAAFERVFVQSYLPLAGAIDAGLAERAAIEARDEFRRSFARAYAEALPTFALTGKRPRMVLDAFDVASKMARSHGARSAQLLLVDGMRFDLAAQVVARVAELCEGRASLADRVTLFSTLPSSTPRQLESLARGIEALRSPCDDRELEPMRGRTADTVRRVRIGSRDLHKLDVVETTLSAAGASAIDVIDDLTEDTARAVAKHVRAQNARTLLFVFGDHGFRFDGGAAKQGGASPEEVIVSGHAFVVGDLH